MNANTFNGDELSEALAALDLAGVGQRHGRAGSINILESISDFMRRCDRTFLITWAEKLQWQLGDQSANKIIARRYLTEVSILHIQDAYEAMLGGRATRDGVIDHFARHDAKITSCQNLADRFRLAKQIQDEIQSQRWRRNNTLYVVPSLIDLEEMENIRRRGSAWELLCIMQEKLKKDLSLSDVKSVMEQVLEEAWSSGVEYTTTPKVEGLGLGNDEGIDIQMSGDTTESTDVALLYPEIFAESSSSSENSDRGQTVAYVPPTAISSSLSHSEDSPRLRINLEASNFSTEQDDPIQFEPAIPNKRKRRKKANLRALTAIRHLQQEDNLIKASEACGCACINNLMKSAKIPGRLIQPQDLVQALNQMRRANDVSTNQIEPNELGSYEVERTNNGWTYRRVYVHIKVLCYLLNTMHRQRKHDGKHLRLAQCKSRGRWLQFGWLAKRKVGLFILFGYVAIGEGHFVGYDAERDRIFDGSTGLAHNLCNEAIEQIFPLGMDCIHQLLVIESDAIDGFRMQIRFQVPEFRLISKGKYNMLFSGEIHADWMV
jgi:hypothetical protein